MKDKISRIKYLVEFLNQCANEYYNGNTPTLSDAEYDALFDELTELEKETRVILSSSPTVRVGYEVMSELKKVQHKIPLLSLAKTKDPDEILKMSQVNNGYLALKIDGLTTELVFEDGILTEASTRGDGTVGELITHNAKVFKDIPKTIPHKGLLRITGEAFIDIETFEAINEKIDNDEDKYSTPRNLAAGSVRQLDSSVCSKRNVRFLPFNVLEGMDDITSRSKRMEQLSAYGFSKNPSVLLNTSSTLKEIEESILTLKEQAEKSFIPIDGIVFFYDDAKFSQSLGRTSHHFRDGIAFKFGDPHFETTLKDIIWNISRTGQLTPIAVFNPVEIDNTIVERASLHNMTFVKDLKLLVGDNIMVSKRNMIIPHVEKNLSGIDRENYTLDFPAQCPICNNLTTIITTENANRTIEVLYCQNQSCPGKKIKKFSHFVSKHSMNIDGLSEQTLEKFIKLGLLNKLSDIYTLKKHRDIITNTEGFGEKSFDNLVDAIENSKRTTLSNLLTAMNIDLIGKNAAKLIESNFNGKLDDLFSAIDNDYDFTQIEGIGEIMNDNIKKWFNSQENYEEIKEIASNLIFEEIENNIDTNSYFFGKKIVITGTFQTNSRDELTKILTSLGAKVSGSVSAKTDILLCGENAGSKLAKAKSLNVEIINEEQLLKLI